ncbi:ribonuclease HI family protein [Patescibacteria group bacterium]|nr:ribonuclease HI family protein [Patescibacteria group bacterium]MBU1921597.1 ribonuclease HI family protein [Patescibacteria group bacterium]
MSKKVRIYTDGGARGNPGPAGIGAVLIELKDGEEGSTVKTISRYLGRATNNQAEYEAIVAGLEAAKALKAEEVEVISDSELVVRQCQGKYKVKDPELAKLFVKVWNLQQNFKKITFDHTLRAGNKEADALVNQAIDRGR